MIDKTSIKELKGIGDKTQKLFEKVGVSTVGDLIRYYPRGYDVYEDPVPVSEVEEGRTQTVSGAIMVPSGRDLWESPGIGEREDAGDDVICQGPDGDA